MALYGTTSVAQVETMLCHSNAYGLLPSVSHRWTRLIKYFGACLLLSFVIYIGYIYRFIMLTGGQKTTASLRSSMASPFMQFLVATPASTIEDIHTTATPLTARWKGAKEKVEGKRIQEKDRKVAIETVINPHIALLDETLFPPSFYTYRPDKRPIKFILQVFAWRRSESLKRLCTSLKLAKYFGFSVDICFHVDALPAPSVVDYIEAFEWPFGKKHKNIYDKTQGIINVIHHLYLIDDHQFNCAFYFAYFKSIITFTISDLDDVKSVASEECL